jgi:hypothetical protein
LVEVLFDAGVPRAKGAALVDSFFNAGLLEADPDGGDALRLHPHHAKAAAGLAAVKEYLAEYGQASPAELAEHLRDQGMGRFAARRVIQDLHHSGSIVKDGGSFGLPPEPKGGDSRESRTFPEDRAGLVKKTVTGKDGKQHTVYTRPDAGQSADEHPAKADPPSADAVDVGGAMGGDAPPGLVAKVKAATARVLTKVATLAYDAALASPQILDVAGLLIDTPEDMGKLGYNPATAGHELQKTGNPLQDAGVPLTPYQFVNLCTKVIPAALSWAKGKLGAKTGEEASDLDALAELLAGMLRELAAEFGMPEPPDAATLAGRLREILRG